MRSRARSGSSHAERTALTETPETCLADGNNTCTGTDGSAACSYDLCKDAFGADKPNPCTQNGAMRCDADAVVSCGLDTDGCLVETQTLDCTVGGNVACVQDGDVPACVSCLPDEECSGAVASDSICVDNVLGSCELADADSCLHWVPAEDCGSQFTCDSVEGCVYSGVSVCDEPVVPGRVLRAARSYGPFDTDDDDDRYGGFVCPGFPDSTPFEAASPDLLFALDVAPATVSLVDPQFGGTGGWMMLLPGCRGAVEDDCRAITSSELSYTNETDTTRRVYLVVDADDLSIISSNPGTFGLAVDTRPLDCGDGHRDASEACDDGNDEVDDGCTPDCEVEDGYACTRGLDSVCTLRSANWLWAGDN